MFDFDVMARVKDAAVELALTVVFMVIVGLILRWAVWRA